MDPRCQLRHADPLLKKRPADLKMNQNTFALQAGHLTDGPLTLFFQNVLPAFP